MTDLIPWQRELLASRLPSGLVITGIRVALDSRGAGGRDVTVDATLVAADLGISPRTVWRRVGTLEARGWLTQTHRPTRGRHGQAGRRARYALTTPTESNATHGGNMAPDHQPESCATQDGPMTLDRNGQVSNQAESFATTTPADGTVRHLSVRQMLQQQPPGPELDDGPVAILASKIAQHTPLRGLRWDQLGPDRTRRLLALIDRHGDQALIDHAIRTCHEPYPTFAQAFLSGWEAMPEPGQRLALVKAPPCDEPGHSGTTRHCAQCAAERLAGERP